MKRLALILSVLLCSALAFARSGKGGADAMLRPPAQEASGTVADMIRQADFSGLRIIESPPAGADALDRAAWKVRRQLTGRDCFDPPCYMFLRRAVRELGLIPAVFATADRRTRDTRIGMSLYHPDPSDPFIHEGPQAYKRCTDE